MQRTRSHDLCSEMTVSPLLHVKDMLEEKRSKSANFASYLQACALVHPIPSGASSEDEGASSEADWDSQLSDVVTTAGPGYPRVG